MLDQQRFSVLQAEEEQPCWEEAERRLSKQRSETRCSQIRAIKDAHQLHFWGFLNHRHKQNSVLYVHEDTTVREEHSRVSRKQMRL